MWQLWSVHPVASHSVLENYGKYLTRFIILINNLCPVDTTIDAPQGTPSRATAFSDNSWLRPDTAAGCPVATLTQHSVFHTHSNCVFDDASARALFR